MTRKRLTGKTTGALIGAAVVLVAFGYLIWGGIGGNLVYFLTPKELLDKGPKAVGASVRLGGLVQGGTVHWNAETRELRFSITDGEVAQRNQEFQQFALKHYTESAQDLIATVTKK